MSRSRVGISLLRFDSDGTGPRSNAKLYYETCNREVPSKKHVGEKAVRVGAGYLESTTRTLLHIRRYRQVFCVLGFGFCCFLVLSAAMRDDCRSATTSE